MQNYWEIARERMEGFCKVCRVCNGKACAGKVPGMGGCGTGSSFHANVNSLFGYRLNMRVIHDISEPIIKTECLGYSLSLPVLAAPIGGISFNMGGKISEEAYIESIISGCWAKGTLGCVGDGVPDFIHETGYKSILNAEGNGIPFIKPWTENEFFIKVEKALKTGAKVIGMDIDAAGLITTKLMGKPVSPKSCTSLSAIRKRIPAKFILKGVMTPDEATLALDAGCDAIVVSNHGGRVLDHCPGTAEVLPKIADAACKEMTILVDGGIRSGVDILKMLALGADIVMIGRPFAVAAVGGLKEGVESYVDLLKKELTSAMVMTGTVSVSQVSPKILY